MNMARMARWGGWMAGILLSLGCIGMAPELRSALLLLETAPVYAEATSVDETTLRRSVARLERQLAARRPAGAYLVVSTTENHFWLYVGGRLIREGRCSTGSYVYLKGSGGRSWLFQTPRGQFFVQSKIVNPVWHKPDWAFVEEGKPIPPPGSPERYEYGVLGRYALAIGNGYLIHGTLYQRLLGLPVTHGCVRLGDADLEVVYRTLPLGAPVYIY